MRGQLVRLILLQVIDDNNGTIRLVPVLSEFSPSNFGATIAEDRGMDGTVLSGSDFLTILALKIDDIDLGIRSVTSIKAQSSLNSRPVWCAMQEVAQDPMWYTRRGY